MPAAAALSPLSTHHPVLLILHPQSKPPSSFPGFPGRAPNSLQLLSLLLPIYCLQSRQSEPLQPLLGHIAYLCKLPPSPTHLPLLALTGRTSIFTGFLRPQGLPSPVSPALCPCRLLFGPCGLCRPFTSSICSCLSPNATEPRHLLYHLQGLCLLHPPVLCLVNSYSCFRCQFKCYAFRGAFKSAHSSFALLECVAFPWNISASL